jgi:hypothetical protein
MTKQKELLAATEREMLLAMTKKEKVFAMIKPKEVLATTKWEIEKWDQFFIIDNLFLILLNNLLISVVQ